METAERKLVNISRRQNQHNAELDHFNKNGTLIYSEDERNNKIIVSDSSLSTETRKIFLKSTNVFQIESRRVFFKWR